MNRWVDVVWRGVVALAPLVVGLVLPAAATPTLERVLFFGGEGDA